MKLKLVSDGTSVGSYLYGIGENGILHHIENVSSMTVFLDASAGNVYADISFINLPADIEFDSLHSAAHTPDPEEIRTVRLLEQEEEATWGRTADDNGRRLALLHLEKMQETTDDLKAFIYSSESWKECVFNDTSFPDYEMNISKGVRRKTQGSATHLGKPIGISKDGSLYNKLGLRKDGETVFVNRIALFNQTWPEVKEAN